MLPQQLAIGAFNDLRDREDDRVAKPGKPLASGALSPGVAVAATVAGFVIALGMAATFPLPTLPLAGVCAAAGDRVRPRSQARCAVVAAFLGGLRLPAPHRRSRRRSS